MGPKKTAKPAAKSAAGKSASATKKVASKSAPGSTSTKPKASAKGTKGKAKSTGTKVDPVAKQEVEVETEQPPENPWGSFRSFFGGKLSDAEEWERLDKEKEAGTIVDVVLEAPPAPEGCSITSEEIDTKIASVSGDTPLKAGCRLCIPLSRKLTSLPPLSRDARSKLVILDVSENPVSTEGLQTVSSKVNWIRELSACKADVVKFPQLSSMGALLRLDLSENSIQLPDDLSGLERLRDLRLRGCKLSTLVGAGGKSIIATIPKLVWLDVSDNELSDIDVEFPAISAVSQLQSLHLRGNPLCRNPNFRQRLDRLSSSFSCLKYLEGLEKVTVWKGWDDASVVAEKLKNSGVGDANEDKSSCSCVEVLDKIRVTYLDSAEDLGAMADSQNVPIDINYAKMIDWLISRKKMTANYQARMRTIRKKINDALQDMPDIPEVIEMVKGTSINYFHCVKIVELMKKDTTTSKTNIFGMYTSKHLKGWQEIVSLFEKDNVVLGDSGQTMTENVNYEIPLLKKVISKSRDDLMALDRKEADCKNTASEFKKKFSKSCKDLHIEGNNIKKELLGTVKELPALFEDVMAKVGDKQTTEAVEYYKSFVRYTLKKVKCSPPSVFLPALDFLIERGNVSASEFKSDLKAQSSTADAEKQEEAPATIDFGDDDGGDGGGIDWGGDGGGEIDWGGDTGDAGGAAEIDWGDSGDAGGIDWGAVDEPAEINWGDDSSTVTPAEQSKEKILEHSETRNEVINDLMELVAFLSQRMSEMQNDDALMAITQFQDAPKELQLMSVEKVQRYLKQINSILEQLTDTRTTQLIMISTSHRYLDRLVQSLEQKLQQANKLESSLDNFEKKRSELNDSLASHQPKYQDLINKTKILKSDTEKYISKLYDGRPVNIMGEINTALRA